MDAFVSNIFSSVLYCVYFKYCPCTFRLHIFDYKDDGKAAMITPPQGLYGLFDVNYYGRSRGVEDYASTGNKLKLDYQGYPTLAYDGFKILVTTFIGTLFLTPLWANSSDEKLTLFSLENRGRHSMQIEDNLHETANPVFWEKIRNLFQNVIRCILPSMLSVKTRCQSEACINTTSHQRRFDVTVETTLLRHRMFAGYCGVKSFHFFVENG